ncbi:hypothetical protein [Curtobacterium flaccumfaciens]|uniref:hypothetical protein n=1 Tax=Curtobacterium flaccumfaciens TaxID=2035 RepID=UPI001E3C6065|nr:hypothetical protein [Curtobacterium allii]MCE0459404.1 hypothetical protein [Curtobacterium allii]
MTTVRGTLRSTETQESEASGPDIGTAREAALAALDLVAFELQQANTVNSKATGESTIRAVARSRATRAREASGPTYEAALQAFRASAPDGWQVQSVRAAD